MFEVLMYLFENYMDGEIELPTNQETIISELEFAGFQSREINCALDWLEGLIKTQTRLQMTPLQQLMPVIRHYTNQECAHLEVETRGFLLRLEQLNILDSITREIVIDRLMALSAYEANIRVKAVILIVLFNQPDKKAALSLLQDMILTDAFDVLH